MPTDLILPSAEFVGFCNTETTKPALVITFG
jgi:hypothetical protein